MGTKSFFKCGILTVTWRDRTFRPRSLCQGSDGEMCLVLVGCGRQDAVPARCSAPKQHPQTHNLTQTHKDTGACGSETLPACARCPDWQPTPVCQEQAFCSLSDHHNRPNKGKYRSFNPERLMGARINFIHEFRLPITSHPYHCLGTTQMCVVSPCGQEATLLPKIINQSDSQKPCLYSLSCTWMLFHPGGVCFAFKPHSAQAHPRLQAGKSSKVMHIAYMYDIHEISM